MKSILRQTIVAVIIFISFFARSESMDSLNEKTVDELLNYALSDKLAIASSYLIDKKLPKEFYNTNNVYDDKLDTVWAVGGSNNGINEYIVFRINFGSQPYNYPLETDMQIINGCAVTDELFKANNRIKKATLELFEGEIAPGQDRTRILQMPILNKTMELNFSDTKQPQTFTIKVNKKLKSLEKDFFTYAYFGKLIIKEVYPGSKYQDTCITEISFKPKNW